MSSALLVTALACFALGGLVDLIFGVERTAIRVLTYLLAAAGSACLTVLGVTATVSRASSIDLFDVFGFRHSALHVDRLSGLFLTLLFGIAVAVSCCFMSWARPSDREHRRGIASGYLLLLGSVAVIICASDAFTFLFAWETLTISFYVLTAVSRSQRRQAGAAWSTVSMGKVSGAALLVGFLLLAGRTGSLTIASWHAVGPGAVHDVAWVLIVVGFGAKIGLVPFQVWIPVGYPAAPGPARAAMAGIAANVGVYGLWRFLGVLGRPPVWLAIAVLLAGGVTALIGITFAGVQSRLGKVIAYSSIENAGLIVTAYGVALSGAIVHSAPLVALGLLAATLQTVAHAIAKSALFVSLANVEAAVGTDELDELRGVGRRLRWSGATFGIGALTLAGLPPTIGFVSEWFILEALMQEFRLPGLALRLGLAAAGALVALTTGLAALAFLRVLGLAFLGKRAGSSHGRLSETGVLGKVGLTILGVGCLALAAGSPWEIRYIARGLSSIVSESTTLQALKSPWVLQPVFHGFSILSPSWMWVVMPIVFSGVLLLAIVLSRGRYLRVRRVRSWHSATAGVSGPSAYSAFGFANPLRHVLGNILGTRRSTTLVVTTPEDDGLPFVNVETHTTVVEPIETYLYRPVRTMTLAAARMAKRLQSGRLNAYVAYMLIALLIALGVTAALR
ncbi:MAG: NADH/ubiquinone/plastoquinone (complex I) [Actinobacteria bacterium]|nr:NADH/ubiquinone/plastoquinone (complex I) [Actinomycetota bacterium]MCL5444940.1 NADH/ubiquinone/plastoquinone (complex I) [Actinomycetota bacterium]